LGIVVLLHFPTPPLSTKPGQLQSGVILFLKTRSASSTPAIVIKLK
jgi:hypothetical protein